jgi:hypothetical protein
VTAEEFLAGAHVGARHEELRMTAGDFMVLPHDVPHDAAGRLGRTENDTDTLPRFCARQPALAQYPASNFQLSVYFSLQRWIPCIAGADSGLTSRAFCSHLTALVQSSR